MGISSLVRRTCCGEIDQGTQQIGCGVYRQAKCEQSSGIVRRLWPVGNSAVYLYGLGSADRRLPLYDPAAAAAEKIDGGSGHHGYRGNGKSAS